jgi:hypothetical protein
MWEYAIVPWAGILLAGMGTGKALMVDRIRIIRTMALAGGGMLLLSPFLNLALPGTGTESFELFIRNAFETGGPAWGLLTQAFLFLRYPLSLPLAVYAVGLNLLCLAGLDMFLRTVFPKWKGHPAMLGRNALGAYVVHIGVLWVGVLFLFRNGLPDLIWALPVIVGTVCCLYATAWFLSTYRSKKQQGTA